MIFKSFSFKYVGLTFVLFLVLLLLSCCVSTNKTTEVQQIEEIDSLNVSDYETRINTLYSKMQSEIRSRDIAFTSSNVPWLESLSDDGKYFYAIGSSEFSASEKAAGSAATHDAQLTLKRNAVEISGRADISITSWELVSRKTFWKRGDDGKKRYIAAVLIRIDRDRVVNQKQE